MTTYDKKYHDGPFKTVGQAAVALDEGKYQEVGETLEGMAEKYRSELNEMLEKHDHLDHYHIAVVTKKHPEFPNVVMQVMGAYHNRPTPEYLQKNFSLYSIDLWEVKKGEPLLAWSLPGPEAWVNILRHPDDHDPDLVKWMIQFKEGSLT